MTDKQIDINNQVEVGLNIAKELLELHKMFEDEVEKNPCVIQTDFIKSKLFYFYQRADWLNVCFKLLEQQLSRKEQECEELKEEALHSDYGIMKNNLEGAITYLEKENKELSKIIDCKNGTVSSLKQQLDQLKQTLAEIKEICGIGIVNGLSEEQYLSELRDWQEQILQKMSECEELDNEAQNLFTEKTNLEIELTQLKAENEHLSEKEEEAKHYLKEAKKFKNCLTEIKELAIVMKNICPEFIKDGNDSMKVINKILQKISEVEE